MKQYKFNFNPPFDIYNTDHKLTVSSARPIVEMVANNENPYQHIYKPVNLTIEDFHNDIKEDVKILTLKNDAGQYLYIPEKYVESKTYNGNTIAYRHKVIAIDLGAVPEDEDFNTLLTLLKSYVYSQKGINPAITIRDVSAPMDIDLDEHRQYEDERALRKIDPANTFIELEKTKTELTRLSTYIEDLECIIKKKSIA